MTTPSASPHEVTKLLVDWSNGDTAALDRLMPLVYDELRRLAHHYMSRERPGHTLQTTALVNEAYLRLVNQKNVHWENRAQFFGLAAKVMRHILTDHARGLAYAKRGGGVRKVSLDEAAILSSEQAADLVALDDALEKLSKEFPRKCRIVELRYFGGMTVEEAAAVLQVSPVTVMRDWNVAKAWLHRELNHGS